MKLTCEQLRELAPELALGAVSGAERAASLSHLADCHECQAYVGRLAEAADLLLLVSPEAEPPSGFESRVLNRMSARPQPRRWRLVLAAAAVALLGGLVGALVALAADGESDVVVAELRTRRGNVVGEVFLYDDHPTWMFVTMTGAPDSEYELEVVLDGGRVDRRPAPWVEGGQASWGDTVDLDVDDLEAIRLLGSGGWRCEAVF